jgi:ribosomal protein S18 acetylase RimI-like enzyme
MVHLADAASPADLDAARALFREYREAVGGTLCFAGFEREVAGLPGDYAPPGGRLLLARTGVGEPVGCGALKPLGDGVVELKRMWTRPAARGQGVARAVATALLEAARAAGHRRVRLETLDEMAPAHALYRSLGFREVAPAAGAAPSAGVRVMELDLSP